MPQNTSSLAPVIGLVGERLIPGGSLMLQGRFGEGLAHTALGIVASAVLGLPGLLLVSANSFAEAHTGQSLAELASGTAQSAPPDTTTTDIATTPAVRTPATTKAS